MAGVPVPHVELGIAASVIVLGAIVALGLNVPVAVAMGLVGLFAVFHGHAHGTEMPLDAAGAAYAAGFMLATALLHLGWYCARLRDRPHRRRGRVGGPIDSAAARSRRRRGDPAHVV